MQTQTNEQTIRFNLKIAVSVIVAVLLALATLQSCGSQKSGCYQTKKFKGYGYTQPKPKSGLHGCKRKSFYAANGEVTACLYHSRKS